MLELLRIRNLALIEDVELEFAPGMNALTGETGAGKSFILRALDFLTGERMGRDMVRPGKEKASVEALFVLPEGDTVIRRELSADTGRSRVYVNDSLSSQDTVKQLKPKLLVHTSQHGQQKLLSPGYQAKILDEFLPPSAPLDRRNELAAHLKDILDRKREVQQRMAALSEKRELLEYQKTEIDKVSPVAGEEEELESRKLALKSQEQAGESVQAALSAICTENGLSDGLALVSRHLEMLGRLAPDYDAWRSEVEDFRLKLSELESALRRGKGLGADGDPEALSLDQVENRLFALSKLKRQLKRSIDEIVGLADEIDDNLSFLDACGLDLKRLEKEETGVAEELAGVLETLNAARREGADVFCRAVESELKDLGFSEHARVEVRFSEEELYPGLHELRGRLLWLPNPGQAPQPLDKIASGGELSRFLLALVSLRTGSEARSPSLLFDEVDAGVGGLTLNSLGEKLAALASRQQVLLISHWPQLAAMASRHFLISKEVVQGETFTRCVRLDRDALLGELSRMAGGGDQGKILAEKLLETN